jgi:hypothetical protein
MVIFLAMVYIGESVAGIDVYTVGISSSVIDNMEGRYDGFKACSYLASSRWTSDHDNSPILQVEVGDIEEEWDKTSSRDGFEDSETTRVATLGVGDDGNWPVLQFKKDGRFWSLKPSILPSLVNTLKHVAIYYGWKRIGVIEDMMGASNVSKLGSSFLKA